MNHRSFMVMIVAVALALSACRGDPPPAPAPEGPSQEELDRAQREAEEARQRAEAEARAAEEARRAAEEERRARVAAARETLLRMVHFEYDRSDITPEFEEVLRQKVDILRASPNVQLRLEGHTDERGSQEYNLALGQRRAESVLSFLTGFGLSADRFETISYGEEQPLVDESTEYAWSMNRRVEFVITRGENQINPPPVSN